MIHEVTFPSLLDSKVGNIFLSYFRRYPCLSPTLFAIHLMEDAPRLAEWMRSFQRFKPISRELREQHWHDPSPDHALGASNVV
jgi:hypothetical protein